MTEHSCKTCRKDYGESDSELYGFCSQRCLHVKAHQLGYRKYNGPLKCGLMLFREYNLLRK
jgi:hypothetical protein